MKEYIQKSDSIGSEVFMNDPQRGFVKKVFEDKGKYQAIKNLKSDQNKKTEGFGKNGDELLKERFNPNNTELNKKRF